MSLAIKTMSLLFFFCVLTLHASAGRYDELAAWARQDSDDYAQLVAQLNRARNGHEVALAMMENVRRQRNTMKTLLQFVRAHPDLRNAAQLGLDKEGQVVWRQEHPDRLSLPGEVLSIEREITRRMSAADAKAAAPMANIFRKYREDPDVSRAGEQLGKMWTENRQRLLQAMR